LYNRPIRILIADIIPTLNKGELAIFIGMLKTFEVLGKVEVSIFSFYPQLDKERYPKDVRIIDVRRDTYLGKDFPEKQSPIRLSWLFILLQHIFFGMLYAIIRDKVLIIANKRIWREYCRSDVFIICHDQVNCALGPKLLFFSPIYITLLAKTLGKPVVIYANGTNKLGNRLWEALARYVLNNVNLVTIREEESYNYLKNISRNKPRIHLVADLAILLSPVDHNRVKRMMIEENIDKINGLMIAVTLPRYLLVSVYPEIKNPEERYKKAIALMARLMDHLVDKLHASVVFLPHCIEPYGQRDDREVAKQIRNLVRNKNMIALIQKEYSPEELKGLISVFDLIIAGRVHSAVSAMTMGVPSIVLTRELDVRTYGIIGKTLKQEEWIYNIERLNPEKLLLKIETLISMRDEISRNLVLQTKIAKEKALLNGKLLKNLLEYQKR
jgi:polysaccharide pyruvyl transferase WcaK-like protein